MDRGAADENARILDQALCGLEFEYGLTFWGELADSTQAIFSLHPQGLWVRDYGGFWDRVKEIGELFKSLKPIRQEYRERLWARFQADCSQVKATLSARTHQSQNAKDEIVSQIWQARHRLTGDSSEDLHGAASILDETLTKLQSERMNKADRDAAWREYKDARQELANSRQAAQDSHFYPLESQISSAWNTAAYGNPHEALKEIKGIQFRMKQAFLSKVQREALRSNLDGAFRSAIGRIEQQRAEREQKQREWLSRQEANIDRWEHQRDNAYDYAGRLRAQIDDLQGKICGSRSSEWVGRAEGWMAEKYQKLSDVERQISELERKISDVRANLRR